MVANGKPVTGSTLSYGPGGYSVAPKAPLQRPTDARVVARLAGYTVEVAGGLYWVIGKDGQPTTYPQRSRQQALLQLANKVPDRKSAGAPWRRWAASEKRAKRQAAEDRIANMRTVEERKAEAEMIEKLAALRASVDGPKKGD